MESVTRFDGFAGNAHPVGVLRRAASPGSRTLRAAYLLHGTAGTGKKTLAAVTAAALVCRGEDRPCGECPACKKAFGSLGHPDILVFRTPQGKIQFPVELIREIRRQAYIRPGESDKKVILIENAEMMNTASANALLKVLEEPPEYLVFILTCDNLSALPVTIPSRCICLELHEISPRRAEQWLLRHFPEETPERLEQALLYGGGNLGRCIRFLEDETVREMFERAENLCRNLCDGREYDLLVTLAALEGNREQFGEFLSMVDRLICETAKAGFVPSSREAASLAARLSPARAVRVHQLGNEMRRGLRANVSLSLLLAVYASGLKRIIES